MPFKKMDVKKEIKKRLESDSDFKEAYTKVEREYDLIKSIVKARKEMNITQKDISEKTNLTQQMVSRIEKYNNSPRLNNFIEYINAIGLDIELKRREKQKVWLFQGYQIILMIAFLFYFRKVYIGFIY